MKKSVSAKRPECALVRNFGELTEMDLVRILAAICECVARLIRTPKNEFAAKQDRQLVQRNRPNRKNQESMMMGTRFVVSLALFCAITSPKTFALDELLPPFGFRWNDPMSRVQAVLEGAKAQIVSREKKEGREIWTVEGLVHPGLKRTLFTFKGGSLFGVELQYEYPDWSIERYNQRMGEIRKYFDEKYGTGKLVSRARDTDGDVVQTLVGYQWMVGATMLELFYFSAQHDALVFRTITVDYKAL